MTIQQPTFPTEDAAHEYLARWLCPWFRFERQVTLKHKLVGNRLRIDFLVTPEPHVIEQFPFDLFGIEVKANNSGIGQFNRALKQAIDYTFCEVDDKRARLASVLGYPLTRVYVFPAPGNILDSSNWHGGSERLAGLFRAGVIYKTWKGPEFRMSAERQWDPYYGGRKTPIHTRDRIGSGVIIKPDHASASA